MASRTMPRRSTTPSIESERSPEEDDPKAPSAAEKLAAKAKEIWDKTGLDIPTIKQMAKGGLAPTIAVSIYQSDAVSSEFTTIGYLVAIISILGFGIMPRAKFIQMMVLDVLAVCLAAALALLMMYCSVKARQHTETTSAAYSSSASAVSGVWLFFQIYMIHTFRARYPQFQFPAVIFGMFVNVTTTYAPRFATMPAAIDLVRRMLGAFLTGLAISTGTSLFIFPLTSRKVVFREMAGYIGTMRAALKAHAKYYDSLRHEDMFGRTATFDDTVEKLGKKGNKVYSPEAEAIRVANQQITDLHGKLHGDLTFAKREFAIGKLGPDDLQDMFRHLRKVMIPVVGLSFIVDIFQRLSDYNRWNEPVDASGLASDSVRERVVHEWNDIMRAVYDPFTSMLETIDEGLQHVLYVLGLAKPPKRNTTAATPGILSLDETKDVEASAVSSSPGEKGFAAHFERKLDEFKVAKRVALRTWSEGKGIHLPPDFFDRPASLSADIDDIPLDSGGMSRDRSRRQLYMFLYMEQLLHSTGKVVLECVRYADEKLESGKLSKSRLIIPGAKRMIKWATGTFKAGDSHAEDHMGDIDTQNHILQLGESYKSQKDPEHLPPETTLQRIGDAIRIIPAFFRSSESAYGFRVACATMTIGIIAFLHDTQQFFVKQRLVWAMIMVNLSMSPTSGQSIFSFVLRILGTILAVIFAFLVWYIPGQKTPGVIIFLFIFVSAGFYVPIKMFRFRAVGIIGIVSTSMIIGYELQVRKVGEAVATSNGQPYYPIYLLAPYRLATVSGGIAVAFFWTFFPYPISEHSVLRKCLGSSLYLLANYYSIIHETVTARMRGEEGDLTIKGSTSRRLEKARNKIFSKQMLMLNGLREYSGFLRWEVPIGGRFPKKRYDSIITCVENIAKYLSLLGYASDTLMILDHDPDSPDSAWLEDFKQLASIARVTSHEITSVLCLLSASITNRQPLPPYLKGPRPYSFSAKLEELDKDILSIRHIAEPGFAAFAVLQISTRCIVGDVERLVREVKKLVGELDFSFHAIHTAPNSRNPSISQLHLPNPIHSRAVSVAQSSRDPSMGHVHISSPTGRDKLD